MRCWCVRAQSVEDRNHKVRIALGNGLRMDIWAKFQQRFGINRVGEIYAATEGNSALLNVHNRVGVVGRASPFLVSKYTFIVCIMLTADAQTDRHIVFDCLIIANTQLCNRFDWCKS
jgi:hypothetical protein